MLAECLEEIGHSSAGDFRLLIAVVVPAVRNDLHEGVRDGLVESLGVSYGGAAVLVPNDEQSGAGNLLQPRVNILAVPVGLQHFQIGLRVIGEVLMPDHFHRTRIVLLRVTAEGLPGELEGLGHDFFSIGPALKQFPPLLEARPVSLGHPRPTPRSDENEVAYPLGICEDEVQSCCRS